MTYYERNLPHWHPAGKTVFITWRLFGSLPKALLSRIKNLKTQPGKQFLVADQSLDEAKSGSCWLVDAKIAEIVRHTLSRGVALRYFRLHAWVIMPNHVHLLLDANLPISRITRGIKGASAREANAALGRIGKPFWQSESFDHWVRNAAQFMRIRLYIEQNPVRAGLAKSPKDWPWSSAGLVA